VGINLGKLGFQTALVALEVKVIFGKKWKGTFPNVYEP